MKTNHRQWVRMASLGLLWLLTWAIAGAQPHTPVTIQSENKIEDVIFPTHDVMVCVDYAGLNDVTAKMEAFALPQGDHLWRCEAGVGRKFQLLSNRVFYDDAVGRFYIGNGPVSAIAAATGQVVWTLDFKATGVVRWIRPGQDKLLILGADRDDKVNDYDDLKKHFEKPLLICANKSDGARLWSYPIDKPDDPGDVHVFHVSDDSAESLLPPDYDKGWIIIKGKYLVCLESSSGKELWKTEKTAVGMPLIQNGIVIANVDKRITSYHIADGRQLWLCDKKVDKTSELIPADNELLLAVYPGEFKDGRNQGSYKLFGIGTADGTQRWEYQKGSDFVEIENIADGRIFIAEKDNNRVVQLNDGKEISREKRKDDYAMGCWFLENAIVDIGKKGLLCRDLDRNKTLWEAKHERSKRGQSFMLKLLKGVSFAMQAASSSMNQDRDMGRRAMQEAQQKKQKDNLEKKYNPQKRGRYESTLWDRPYNQNTEYGTVARLGSSIIFPTNQSKVIGVSADNGAVEWQVDTVDGNPWPYFTPDQSLMVVADGKVAHIVQLE
ncbi:MAG: PQQ-like beta-propeller repeat protein [candidate division Zixibacteria bacterium]|nr:PQQ-like beta-propeller repeat protein [candidate division Zixibacteria bacterium]